jgi:hypothetical protein
MKFFFPFILTTLLFAQGINTKALLQIQHSQQHNSFCFAVMGDNRDGDAVFQKLLSMLSPQQYVFGINNGDLVAHGFWFEYDNYLQLVTKSPIPIINVIGNHEIPFYGSRENFKKYIGKTYFSFPYAQSYFIFLDNANKKSIQAQQLQWLIQELQKAQNYRYRFVFLHVPLFDPRQGELKKGHSMKNITNAKKLLKLFEKYNVSMVFSSHIHTYLEGKWGKIPFIITGGAGAPNSRDNGTFHYVKVCVTPQGVTYAPIVLK